MYHKRHYVGMFAALILGGLCVFLLFTYREWSAPIFLIGAAICGGCIAACSRADDIIFRDEAIELLQSLRTEVRNHAREHVQNPHDPDSTQQQIAGLRAEVASIQQRHVNNYTKEIVGNNDENSTS